MRSKVDAEGRIAVHLRFPCPKEWLDEIRSIRGRTDDPIVRNRKLPATTENVQHLCVVRSGK